MHYRNNVGYQSCIKRQLQNRGVAVRPITHAPALEQLLGIDTVIWLCESSRNSPALTPRCPRWPASLLPAFSLRQSVSVADLGLWIMGMIGCLLGGVHNIVIITVVQVYPYFSLKVLAASYA